MQLSNESLDIYGLDGVVVRWLQLPKATFPPPKLKFFLKNKSSLQFFFLRMSDGADVRLFCLILIHVINLVITENSFSVLRQNMYNCSVFALTDRRRYE